MCPTASRAWCLAVGPRLDRRVRPHSCPPGDCLLLGAPRQGRELKTKQGWCVPRQRDARCSRGSREARRDGLICPACGEGPRLCHECATCWPEKSAERWVTPRLGAEEGLDSGKALTALREPKMLRPRFQRTVLTARGCSAWFWCGLTFEVRRDRRQDARPARKMILPLCRAGLAACRWASPRPKG